MKSIKTIAALFAMVATAGAVTVGQIDTFNNEITTTSNWLTALLGSPNPAPPLNVPNVGPAGLGDRAMKLTALGGDGPGSRLSVINVAQWTGNYLAAGIGGIAMDLINLGPTDLDFRLLFGSGGPPTDVAVSTNAIHIAGGSPWIHVFFPITPGSLTALLGTVDNALGNTTELRLYHSTELDFPGPAVVANVGVDNITAIGINATPEPGTTALICAGVLLLAAGRLARRRA